LGLPYNRYKQPEGGPLTPQRRSTRRVILRALEHYIDIPPRDRRTIMRNGGGDALDAVIAAVGAFQSWRHADHAQIARHDRYPREGYIFA
jgi:hypothetical protein